MHMAHALVPYVLSWQCLASDSNVQQCKTEGNLHVLVGFACTAVAEYAQGLPWRAGHDTTGVRAQELHPGDDSNNSAPCAAHAAQVFFLLF